MKKKFLIALLLVLAAMCLTMTACEQDFAQSSLKTLTKPYITQYDCTEAKLGSEDLLEKYDYIRITLIDNEQLEVSYKSKNGKKHAYTGNYTFDDETHELSGDIGIIGIKFTEKIKIENGSFTIKKNILGKPLVMKFKSK